MEQVFGDTWNFMRLFIIYMGIVTVVEYTLETEIYRYDPDEGVQTYYPDIQIFFAYFFHTWRNSVGDISAPEYSYWLN